MTGTAAMENDAHRRIQLLLPWYVNRSLGRDEHAQVEDHVRLCLSCRRELVGLGRLATAVADSSDLDVAADTSFAALAARLPQRPAIVVPAPAVVSRAARSGFHRLVPYALAASVVFALVPVALRVLEEPATDSFRTLSASRTASPADIQVVFAPSLSDQAIAGVLAQLGARRVGAVNSAGAIGIALDGAHGATEVQQAVAALRARGDVLLAEPASQP